METGRKIIWLDHTNVDQKLIGTKAANIARLSNAGFPVPDGFCISVIAWKDVLSRLQKTNDSYNGLTRHFRDFVLPSDLEKMIIDAYRTLCRKFDEEVKVAVRSSALCEDLRNASFAGQYESFLNIQGESDLIIAIKKCWTSQWSTRVFSYKNHQSVGKQDDCMAVIIQKMVPAEFAGVLFTKNLLTNDTAKIVIEMSSGLGDEVASGATMPQYITLDRQTGNVTIPRNTTIHAAAPFPEQLKWTSLLDLALKVEEFFNSPQDIEWAYSNNLFWILQSRPITNQRRTNCRQIWTRANAGEILPDVVTPLTWSIFKPVFEMAGYYRGRSLLTLHWKWQHPCGEFPDSPRLVKGRAYMELASVYAGFGCMPGVTPEVLERMLGFEYHLCLPEEIPKRHLRWHPMDILRGIRFWLEILCITDTLSAKARRWLRSRVSVRCSDPSIGRVQPEVIIRDIEHLLKEAAKILALHVQCTSLAFSAYGLLDRLALKYVDSEELLSFEASLISDFENISTVQQAIAIWDMAQTIGRIPQVKRIILEMESTDQIIEAWRGCPEAADLIRLWDTFMNRFGERGSQEFELAVPHWDEDASFVLLTMREILGHAGPNPRERLFRQQEIGRQKMKLLGAKMQKCGSFLDSWLFNRLMSAYNRYVPLRENLKYCLVGRFNALRRSFLNLGRILERKGVLSDFQDIFFLRYEEIRSLIENPVKTNFEKNTLISRRKDDHHTYSKSPASDVWALIDNKAIPMELPQWQDTNVLQGIGCSSGYITGPAYVLPSILEGRSVKPRHIIVAPSIDPGLTPLFLTAAGLVTEVGGLLSHGATVAREYGLPAVVNVPHATKIIQMGQEITVDGFTGKIYLGPVKGV